ncbi:LuxR C-terminal-related transcriptional regulator [Desertibacillus haloalkaliphilus]|uniref:LuxR C-terminal-related transcriptional regulator n=1 Tax=Desertibacillus haloalkaliphilus TaxID=1328930 RepID=UPI001C26069B|nr:response regulator transcription factor [Desertibacillus haloalkaliphilus]MBU8908116.1 response regulator transcription factor [Desertibacillus haloalkaliphilus]
MKKEKIAVIDDHLSFREGLKKILSITGTFDILSAGSWNMEKVIQFEPSIILLDRDCEYLNVFTVIELIKKELPLSKMIIVSSVAEDEEVMQFVKNGVLGFLLKDVYVETFIHAINVVRNGQSYMHHKATNILLHDYLRISNGGQSRNFQPPKQFSKREYQVLELLVHGLSNREIGERLLISSSTVKNHVNNLMKKINVNDRTTAAVTAIKKGWVQIEMEGEV